MIFTIKYVKYYSKLVMMVVVGCGAITITNAFQSDLDYNDKNNEIFSSCKNRGEF